MSLKLAIEKNTKDCWQTPKWLFDALNVEFAFALDVAASKENALCSHYITQENDALSLEWKTPGAVWCNPPYSHLRPWVEKAAAQSAKHHKTIVMLVPQDMSTKWFSVARESADEIRIITGGRISFLNPETRQTHKGNNKGSMLLIWRACRALNRAITTVSIRDLMQKAGTLCLEREPQLLKRKFVDQC